MPALTTVRLFVFLFFASLSIASVGCGGGSDEPAKPVEGVVDPTVGDPAKVEDPSAKK